MSDFESYPTIGANHLLMRQMQQQSCMLSAPSEFDPYQALLKRKNQIDSGELPPIQDVNQDAVYELQEFCRKYGIIGFNCGRMNPKSTLNMLKRKMGIQVESPVISQTSTKTILRG